MLIELKEKIQIYKNKLHIGLLRTIWKIYERKRKRKNQLINNTTVKNTVTDNNEILF